MKDDRSLDRIPLSRRQFLKALGSGIIIYFSCEDSSAQERRSSASQTLPDDVNAYLRIGNDGRVTGFTGKAELGQGIVTALAQILAEELDVPFQSVDMIMGDT